MSGSEISEDLLYVECALELCGVKLAETAMAECASLLTIIRKKLKIQNAIIVHQSINRILFDDLLIDMDTFVVCNDIMDPKYGFNAEKKEILQHSMKMYMGIDIIIDSGKTGTLVIASRECRQFSPFDIAFAAEICGCIDDKYRMRRDARASGAVSNLTICSVLLSGIKGYIGAAMDCLDQIGEAFRDIRRSQSSASSMSDDFQELKSLVERFESHKTNVQSSIDRALNVAKNYTSNDKKEYFLSCFQSQPEGFIQSMNEVLMKLSQLMPDFNVLWSYRIDSSLAHCAHRTFYAHLLFFLEGLIFRWAPHCSMAQITIAFDPHQIISYYSPKHCYKPRLSRYAQRVTSQVMLSNSILRDHSGDDEQQEEERYTQEDYYISSDDEAGDVRKSPGGCESIYKAGNPFNLNLSVSTDQQEQEPTRPNGRIQQGYLRIIFQPLDLEDDIKNIVEDEYSNKYSAGSMTSRGRHRSEKWKGSHKHSTFKVTPSGDSDGESDHESVLTRQRRKSFRHAAGDDIGPYESTLQLLQVLDDFLKSIDSRATASIAPPMFSEEVAEPQYDAYMLLLPCYFTLQHDSAKERRLTQNRISRNRKYQLRGVGKLQRAADVAPNSKVVEKLEAAKKRIAQAQAHGRNPAGYEACYSPEKVINQRDVECTPTPLSESGSTVLDSYSADDECDLTPSLTKDKPHGATNPFLHNLVEAFSVGLSRIFSLPRRQNSFNKHNSVSPDPFTAPTPMENSLDRSIQ